jgi:glycosyltransferase involved in cell wall biosynthesis
MTVSVILATIRPDCLEAAVASIREQSYADLEIIVVPQGNDPKLREVVDALARADARVRVVHLEKGNASAARNAGIAASRGEILAFTDDDCEADKRWIELMVQIFEQRPEIGFIGGEVVAPPARRFTISSCPSAQVLDTWYQPSKSGWEAPPGFYLIGANMGMRRSVIDSVGLFDPGLGPGTRYPACEDVDYVLRCELADVGFLTSPRLIIKHTHGRRYGVMPFLKHQRNYAFGRGALLVKLRWMNHRIAPRWGAKMTARDHLKKLATDPARWLLKEVYGGYFERKAVASFGQEFELSSDGTCVPRAHTGERPSPSTSAAAAK